MRAGGYDRTPARELINEAWIVADALAEDAISEGTSIPELRRRLEDKFAGHLGPNGCEAIHPRWRPRIIRYAIAQVEDAREKARVAREESTGRYTFKKMDRACTCGHPLGDHAAARSRFTAAMAEASKARRPQSDHAEIEARVGRMFQHCMAYDTGAAGEPCACECFTPANRRAS